MLVIVGISYEFVCCSLRRSTAATKSSMESLATSWAFGNTLWVAAQPAMVSSAEAGPRLSTCMRYTSASSMSGSTTPAGEGRDGHAVDTRDNTDHILAPSLDLG